MALAIMLNAMLAAILLLALFLALWRVGWKGLTYEGGPDISSGPRRDGSAIMRSWLPSGSSAPDSAPVRRS
jgi:hypothetical protein